MAGGPGSYVFGAEEKKELMDVIEAGSLFRYGTPGVDGFQGKVATFEKEMAELLGHKHVVATNAGTSSLMAYCLELVTTAAASDQNEVAKDFFLSAYRSQATMEMLRKRDKMRSKVLFREFCPDWTDDRFEEAVTLVSGIKYATLMTTAESAPLPLRITGALNAILSIYQVPKERRDEKLAKALGLDYRKLSLRILKEFREYVDRSTEQALLDLMARK